MVLAQNSPTRLHEDPIIITRRGVLTGLIAAPMIVQPTSIMRVRAIIDPFGHHVRWLQDEFDRTLLGLLQHPGGPIPHSTNAWLLLTREYEQWRTTVKSS